jgi:hypothetical protein
VKRFVAAALALSGCQATESASDTILMSARVQPGEEVTWCRYVKLGVDEIARFAHAWTGSSHHAILYETDLEQAPSDPFICDDVELPKSRVLYAPEEPSGELALPDGVAFRWDTNRIALVEWHLVNPGTAAVDAELTLDLFEPEAPSHMAAGALLYYHPAIHVPALGSATARMRCLVPSDVTLWWMASHHHELATGFSAQLVDRNGADRGPIHRAPFQVAREQAIEFACDYQNPRAEPVIEGPSARDDEMCMLAAIYYPRMDDPFRETCSGADSGPMFDGTATCAATLACLEARAGDAVGSEECLVSTSASSTPALNQLVFECLPARCALECAGMNASCRACLEERCLPERAACLDAP